MIKVTKTLTYVLGRQLAVVDHVYTLEAAHALEHQKCRLERHSLPNWKPLELLNEFLIRLKFSKLYLTTYCSYRRPME